MDKRYPNMSEEEYQIWKNKLSVAHKNKKTWNTGKKLSQEHKQNLSSSHKGYVMPLEQKNKISKSCSETWNKPEMKDLNRKMQKKRFAEGKHNFIEIIKIRQLQANPEAKYGMLKSEWNLLSKKIRERDNCVCQSCFQTFPIEELNVHHIVPWAISHDNSNENLVTLCPSCHSSIEYYTKLALYRAGGETVEKC